MRWLYRALMRTSVHEKTFWVFYSLGWFGWDVVAGKPELAAFQMANALLFTHLIVVGES